MASVVILKGQSQYGAIRLLMDQFAAALAADGHTPLTLDFMDAAWPQALEAIAARPEKPAFLFAMNIGLDVRVSGLALDRILGAPLVCQIVDHPGFHLERLNAAPAEAIILTIDRTHAAFIDMMYGPGRFRAVACLPSGGSVPAGPVPPQTARDIPILFTGTLRKGGETPWANLPKPERALLDETLARTLAEDAISVEAALRAALAARGLEGDAEIFKAMLPAMAHVANAVHTERRFQCMKTLAKAGLPVHVYGKGWDGQMYRFKSFTFGGEGEAAETHGLLARTQIALNTNTHFIAGGHDRVFTAMAHGAAVVSDESSYYAEAFAPGSDILFYRWTALDALPGLLDGLLGNVDRRAAIAEAGRAASVATQSWRARAASLFDLLAA